jgi:hypothetical protein
MNNTSSSWLLGKTSQSFSEAEGFTSGSTGAPSARPGSPFAYGVSLISRNYTHNKKKRTRKNMIRILIEASKKITKNTMEMQVTSLPVSYQKPWCCEETT